LALLALEFDWAERFLERTVERAEAAKQAANDATLLQKVLTSAFFVLAAAAAIAAVFVWDVPLLPV
ncbi:MAG: hypothetical protein H0U03_01720, partial [Actinobacteria bacterium]|nr:hypothetical protein [Actinomycetota bacterium]